MSGDRERPEAWRRSTRHAVAAAALALACASVTADAAPKISLVYETRVTLSARILVHDPGGGSSHDLGVYEGLTATPFPLTATVPTRGGRLTIDATIEARPDEASELCALRVEATVRADGRDPSRTLRDARLGPDRLLLVDVWSDPAVSTRVVLVLSARWERVPSLTALAPGAEPVDLIVEVLLDEGTSETLLERHRLGGLVGSPIRYAFRQFANLADRQEQAGDPGELVIEIVPRSIENGVADLAVRIRHVGDSPYSDLAALDLSVSEKLPPGGTVRVPLPRGPGSAPLVFRLTPYF